MTVLKALEGTTTDFFQIGVETPVKIHNEEGVAKVEHSGGSLQRLSVLNPWVMDFSYLIGDLCIYLGRVYRCITAHTSTNWDTDVDNWAAIGGATPAHNSLPGLNEGDYKHFTAAEYSSVIPNKQSNIMLDPIPIGFCKDGVVAAPDAKADYTNGNFKTSIRKFSGTTNQDVTFEWPVDDKIDTSYKIQFRVCYIITEATGPANGEIVSFKLSGFSVGNSDATGGTYGSAVASAYTHGASDVKDDIFKTAWSGDVTITDLAAGETVMMNIVRDATGDDTYAQKIGVPYFEVRWKKTT